MQAREKRAVLEHLTDERVNLLLAGTISLAHDFQLQLTISAEAAVSCEDGALTGDDPDTRHFAFS
jgi:hypothetical protein